MAIIADVKINRKNPMTMLEILNHVKGTNDIYGNPFDWITLVFNGKVGRSPSKTHGFEDVFINIEQGDVQPTIKYRGLGRGENGTMDFIRNEFGILEAYVPRTPHNVKMIASYYYNNMFYVKDSVQRAEMKKIADEMLEKRTQDQIAIDNSILDKSKRTPYDEHPFKEDVSLDKKIANEDKALMQKQMDELKKMNEQLMAELRAKEPQPVKKEIPATEKSRLEKEYVILKAKAEEFGMVVPVGTTLGQLKTMINDLPQKAEGLGNDNQRDAHLVSGKK
jgi:hypothetical protein